MIDSTLLVAQTAADAPGLTTAGAIIMTASILLVVGLAAFCMARILGETNPSRDHHAPLDIDTRDLDT